VTIDKNVTEVPTGSALKLKKSVGKFLVEKERKEAGQVFPPPCFPLSGKPASLTEGG
jgi:hypothetical protein